MGEDLLSKAAWSIWAKHFTGLPKLATDNIYTLFDGDKSGGLSQAEAASAVNFLELVKLESNLRYKSSALLAILLIMLPWAFASMWLLQDVFHDLMITLTYEPAECATAVRNSLSHAQWFRDFLATFYDAYKYFHDYLENIARAGKEPRALLCITGVFLISLPLLGLRAAAYNLEQLEATYWESESQCLLLILPSFLGLYLSLTAAKRYTDARGGSHHGSAEVTATTISDEESGLIHGPESWDTRKKFDDINAGAREVCLLPIRSCQLPKFRKRLEILFFSVASLVFWQVGTFPIISKVLTVAVNDPSDPTRAALNNGATGVLEQAASWQSFFGGVAPALDYGLSWVGAPKGSLTSTVWAFNSATGLAGSLLKMRQGYAPTSKDESFLVSLQKQSWAAAKYQTQWSAYYWVWLAYANLPWICIIVGAVLWFSLSSSQTKTLDNSGEKGKALELSLEGTISQPESAGGQLLFKGSAKRRA